ncbi:hypothetical protein [Oerskovia turbata]
MTTTTRRPRARLPRAAASLAGLLALVLSTAACAGGAAAPGSANEPAPTASAPAPETSPAPDEPTTPEAGPAASDSPTSPEAAFRAWLTASRAPDTATACGLLAPELVDRMVAEMTAQGWPGITDCASMITTTAELYAAVGDVPEVELSVLEERPDATVLSVAYVGGDCGTAVMAPRGAGWVITEQSEEQC